MNEKTTLSSTSSSRNDDNQNEETNLSVKLNSQFIRKPIINPTESINDLLIDRTSSLDDGQMFSDEEWIEHLNKLKKCTKCNRTFFADRIRKHEINCKAQPI